MRRASQKGISLVTKLFDDLTTLACRRAHMHGHATPDLHQCE